MAYSCLGNKELFSGFGKAKMARRGVKDAESIR